MVQSSLTVTALIALSPLTFDTVNSAAIIMSPGYVLADKVDASNFFDYFTFFTDADPTHGFVKYIGKVDAQDSGLLLTNGTSTTFKVDSTNKISDSSGRPSIRLEGSKTYTHGLFIADVRHMPGGICGTWPACWTLGSGQWPTNGEIDILDGVNDQSTNLMTLHTSNTCAISEQTQFGHVLNNDCAVPSSTQGCSVRATDPATYGQGFNANGGGVFAMQWTSEAIRTWFLPCGKIPASLDGNLPPEID